MRKAYSSEERFEALKLENAGFMVVFRRFRRLGQP